MSTDYILNGTLIKEYSSENLIADDQLKNQRLLTCNSCENNINDMCNSCHCIISVKVSYKNNTCPEFKW